MAKDEVIVPLDDLAKAAGLDIADFSDFSIKMARYPAYGNGLFMVPMDLMSLQPEYNTDYVKEAGFDPEKFPEDGKTLLEWAEKLTKRDGDTVTRSGIMMTGSGVQPTVTWGIVAAQMGFKRASDDLKQAAVNPDAGIAAMHYVLDLFDKYKVSTRDVTDRYKAFGTGQGSIFWTGPWTINGYIQQKLPFRTAFFPKIGNERKTYFEMGGMEFYKQSDPGRYAATMDAVKWLSDNSFLWTTQGRGASPRKSILDRPDYKTAGAPVGRARCLRRRHELRHRGRDPRAQRTELHHLQRRQLPRQDARDRLGRTGEAGRGHGEDRGASGRRTSTRASRWRGHCVSRQTSWWRLWRRRPAFEVRRRMAEAALARDASKLRADADLRPRIDWVGYLFIGFFTVPFLIFNVGPVLFGIYVGFTEWGIIGDPDLGRPAELSHRLRRRVVLGRLQERASLRADHRSRA